MAILDLDPMTMTPDESQGIANELVATNRNFLEPVKQALLDPTIDRVVGNEEELKSVYHPLVKKGLSELRKNHKSLSGIETKLVGNAVSYVSADQGALMNLRKSLGLSEKSYASIGIPDSDSLSNVFNGRSSTKPQQGNETLGTTNATVVGKTPTIGPRTGCDRIGTTPIVCPKGSPDPCPCPTSGSGEVDCCLYQCEIDGTDCGEPQGTGGTVPPTPSPIPKPVPSPVDKDCIKICGLPEALANGKSKKDCTLKTSSNGESSNGQPVSSEIDDSPKCPEIACTTQVVVQLQPCQLPKRLQQQLKDCDFNIDCGEETDMVSGKEPHETEWDKVVIRIALAIGSAF